jgi:hypothetical protein
VCAGRGFVVRDQTSSQSRLWPRLRSRWIAIRHCKRLVKDDLGEIGGQNRFASPCHGRAAGRANFWRVTIDEARTGRNNATGTGERHHRTKREEHLVNY